MSALVFLAIVFAAILAISAVLALMIWDPEQTLSSRCCLEPSG